MMGERYIKSDDQQLSPDVTTADLLDQTASIDHGRGMVYGVAGCIDASVVNESLDMMRREFGSNGTVKERIDLLQSYIAVAESRLAILDGIKNEIETLKVEPQMVYDWATQVLEEIDERRTDIAWQIQDLQKQKNTAANRVKIGSLEQEKSYSDAALYDRALNARINANADLKRLNGVLAGVSASKVTHMDMLRSYQNEVQILNERVAKVSAALSGLVGAMTEFKATANQPYRGEGILHPDSLPDIKIEAITRPVSYGDHPSFSSDAVRPVHNESPEHPANTLEFPDAVTVELTFESTPDQEVMHPDSLEPLLRERAMQAQASPRSVKKNGRIKNLLKSNKLRV